MERPARERWLLFEETMTTITQITTCKGRFEDVERNLPRWLASDIDKLVLVDFDCPDGLTRRIKESGILEKDKRVSVMQVGPRTAGPFYDHGRARNMGSQVQPASYLFFLDADSTVRAGVVDDIKQRAARLDDDNRTGSVSESDVYTPIARMPAKLKYEGAPLNWTLEGQLFIRSSTFILLNGFCEGQEKGWGGETHDLVMRASLFGASLEHLSPTSFQHNPHDDVVRCRHLARRFISFDKRLPLFKEGDKRDAMFREAAEHFVSRYARSVRAQPGRQLGLSGPSDDVIIWTGPTYRRFSPNDNE